MILTSRMCSSYAEKWNHWRIEWQGSLKIINMPPPQFFLWFEEAKCFSQGYVVAETATQGVPVPGRACSHFAVQPTDLPLRNLRSIWVHIVSLPWGSHPNPDLLTYPQTAITALRFFAVVCFSLSLSPLKIFPVRYQSNLSKHYLSAIPSFLGTLMSSQCRYD